MHRSAQSSLALASVLAGDVQKNGFDVSEAMVQKMIDFARKQHSFATYMDGIPEDMKTMEKDITTTTTTTTTTTHHNNTFTSPILIMSHSKPMLQLTCLSSHPKPIHAKSHVPFPKTHTHSAGLEDRGSQRLRSIYQKFEGAVAST